MAAAAQGDDGLAPPPIRDAPPAARLRSAPEPPGGVGAALWQGLGRKTLEPALDRARRSTGAGPRFDPGMPGTRALLAVAVAAAVLAGGWLWASRPRPQALPGDAPTLGTNVAAATAVPPDSTPVPAPAGTGTPSGSVVVQVAGKVRRPGVRTLPTGTRVIDAIKAAGGLRPGAGTRDLNLARPLVDGEQILVGRPAAPAGQPAPPAQPAPGTAPSAPGGAVPGAVSPGSVHLNSATSQQLQELPGVGPVLAQRIIDYRTEVGGFRSIDQLQEVSGIGEQRYADLKDLVRI